MRISGSCHCGNITFALEWSPDPSQIAGRACSCSFCVKHGGVWTSCPTGSLRIRVKEAAQLSRYAFGSRTAEFHVCAQCGVVPVVTSRIENRLYAVVNVNAFEDTARALVRSSPASFDGEGTDARLARRTRNWIPDVQAMSG